jgi:hypothetical protein
MPDAKASILPRVLVILLAHDGIVAADPLADIEELASRGQSDKALAMLRNVLSGLAEIEPLIEHDILHFTDLRPTLTSQTRSAVLSFFGLDPSLTVFTNFLEAAVSVEEMPVLFAREYRPQVVELFRLIGMPPPPARNLDEAVGSLKELAASVIEVTWQMAVCAEDPACDLALSSATELSLANLVLQSGAGSQTDVWAKELGRTRHVQRLRLGGLPNLAPEALTIGDTIAIRRSEFYEEFRGHLRRSMDVLDDGLRNGQEMYAARDVFEEHMTDAAAVLSRSVRRSTLRSRLRDASIPAAVGAVGAMTLSPQGPALAAGSGIATALTSVLWQWLTARSKPHGVAAAIRYVSLLSGAAS